MGEPRLFGHSQLITTFEPEIVVTGAYGLAGVSAARTETELELGL
jgi:hypothetical protein